MKIDILFVSVAVTEESSVTEILSSFLKIVLLRICRVVGMRIPLPYILNKRINIFRNGKSAHNMQSTEINIFAFTLDAIHVYSIK